MIEKEDFKNLAQQIVYKVFPEEKDSFDLSADILIDDLFRGKDILQPYSEAHGEFQFFGETKTILEFIVVLYSMYEVIQKILPERKKIKNQYVPDEIGSIWKQKLVDAGISNTKAEKIFNEFFNQFLMQHEKKSIFLELGVNEKNRVIKILFLAANPKDTSQLRLDEEMRGIDHALRQAEFRDKFDVKQQWAVRIIDLQGYLLRHKPDIVHFSGHGSESNEIMLEDNDGNSKPVSTRALSQLFSVLKDNIRCVVLNACYSEQQALAIAQHIDCVVGMSKAIGDAAAISFAVAFYQGLGYGRDVKTAFELGCVQIDLEGLNERDTPKLLAINANPQEILFT